MILEALDITTAPWVHNPEQAYRIAGKINNKSSNPHIRIENYPFTRSIPGQVKAIKKEDVLDWQKRYDVLTERVHLAWMANWPEIGRQIFGDWYSGVGDYFTNQALEFAMGPSSNNHGTELAEALGTGVNIHPNVIEWLSKKGLLSNLRTRVRFIYGENSIGFSSLHQKDRDVLADPRVTVRHDVTGYHLQGFLLALDHMFGLEKRTDQGFISQKVDEILEVVQDKEILNSTKAMHLAQPGHDMFQIEDANAKRLLRGLYNTPFKHPVRVAWDFSPREMKKMSEEEQYDYLYRLNDWASEQMS